MKRFLFVALLAIASPVLAQNLPAGSTNGSSTITTGGAFQTVLSPGTSGYRKGCLIQNPTTASEVLYVNVGSASPSTANSFSLSAGATFSCNAAGVTVQDVISVEAATTSHAFVMTSQ